MTTPYEPAQAILLFVDNYYAKPTAWDSLATLIAKDSDLKDRFIVKKFSFSPSLRLEQITEKLAETIRRECLNTELVLVSHGLGTVVIFKYLVQLMQANTINPDLFIQQIILFAPIINQPAQRNGEQSFYQQLTNLFKAAFPTMYQLNSKRKALQVDIDQLSLLIKQQLINGKFIPGKLAPMPILAICGLEDTSVRTRMVADHFGLNNQQTVSGNHLTLIEPTDQETDRWQVFRKALLAPYGHRHTLLIRSLNLTVFVRPGSRQQRTVRKEQSESSLIEDHAATIHYLIDVASNNTCRSRFQITCFVQENAYIDEVYKSYERFERAESYKQSTFKRHHTTYHSEFDSAKAGNPSELLLEIINGFNDTQFRTDDSIANTSLPERNFYVPFFLGMGDRHYQQVTLELDLRAFGPEQRPYADQIKLHWLPDEVDYNMKYHPLMNKFLGIGTRLNYSQTELSPGQWQFATRNIRYGTLLLTWSLQPD